MEAVLEQEAISGEVVIPADAATQNELFKPSGLDRIIAAIRAEASAHVPDISTEKGRKAIASLAYKVAKAKTKLDEAGKSLVADKKRETAEIDAERKRMRDELDQIKDDVRRPLTDWKEKESRRVAEHDGIVAAVTRDALSADRLSLADLDALIDTVRHYEKRDWQEFAERFADASARAMILLESTRVDLVKRQQEATELARLRAEEAERKESERVQRIADEAAAAATRRAEAEAAHRAEELARQARVEQEAAERAIRQQQANAERAQREADNRVRDAESAAERAKVQAEQAVEQERQRAAAAERAENAERERREENTRIRGRVNSKIVAALMTVKLNADGLRLNEDHAKAIVTALAKREIPCVQVTY